MFYSFLSILILYRHELLDEVLLLYYKYRAKSIVTKAFTVMNRYGYIKQTVESVMLSEKEFIQIVISGVDCLDRYDVHISVNNLNILYGLILKVNQKEFPGVTKIREIPFSKYETFLAKIKSWTPETKYPPIIPPRKLQLVVDNTKPPKGFPT